MSMNIQVEIGTKIKVTEDSIGNGYSSVEEKAREHLEIGGIYTIEDISIENWYTDVWVKEIPGVCFNSVSFEDID